MQLRTNTPQNCCPPPTLFYILMQKCGYDQVGLPTRSRPTLPFSSVRRKAANYRQIVTSDFHIPFCRQNRSSGELLSTSALGFFIEGRNACSCDQICLKKYSPCSFVRRNAAMGKNTSIPPLPSIHRKHAPMANTPQK